MEARDDNSIRGVRAEQRLLLARRKTGGDPLECVPKRDPVGAELFHGEVALEHAALRAEQLDAGLDVRPPKTSDLL
jgi:hypothetical protein